MRPSPFNRELIRLRCFHSPVIYGAKTDWPEDCSTTGPCGNATLPAAESEPEEEKLEVACQESRFPWVEVD